MGFSAHLIAGWYGATYPEAKCSSVEKASLPSIVPLPPCDDAQRGMGLSYGMVGGLCQRRGRAQVIPALGMTGAEPPSPFAAFSRPPPTRSDPAQRPQ